MLTKYVVDKVNSDMKYPYTFLRNCNLFFCSCSFDNSNCFHKSNQGRSLIINTSQIIILQYHKLVQGSGEET